MLVSIILDGRKKILVVVLKNQKLFIKNEFFEIKIYYNISAYMTSVRHLGKIAWFIKNAILLDGH